MIERVLKIDVGGRPISWISREEGALMYCRDQVAWEAGMEHIVLRGGYSRATRCRSVLLVSTIVAAHGVHRGTNLLNDIPALTNRRLFRRDDHMCLYCGDYLYDSELTRDHVMPVSRGGQDIWENVVSACRECNHRKADKLLDECDMRLLAVPYAPNRAEGLILENRHILGDQMAFLKGYAKRRTDLLYLEN